MRAGSLWAVLAILATGCVAPQEPSPKLGGYKDYREFVMAITEDKATPGPESMHDRVHGCVVDTMLMAYTPSELAKLDAYVRGESVITDSEALALERRIDNRRQSDAEFFANLEKVCPGLVQALGTSET